MEREGVGSGLPRSRPLSHRMEVWMSFNGKHRGYLARGKVQLIITREIGHTTNHITEAA